MSQCYAATPLGPKAALVLAQRDGLLAWTAGAEPLLGEPGEGPSQGVPLSESPTCLCVPGPVQMGLDGLLATVTGLGAAGAGYYFSFPHPPLPLFPMLVCGCTYELLFYHLT